MDLIKKYFEYPNGRKEWCVTGEFGSLSFWYSEYQDNKFGGVEHHYNSKSKPSYLGTADHHDKCMQNGSECWHDGTSLWASEYWIPDVLPLGAEHIWQTLSRYYDERLKPEEENANVPTE